MNNYLRFVLALLLVAMLVPGVTRNSYAAFQATGILGHGDGENPAFTLSGINNSPNDEGLDIPKGSAVDVDGRRLFVADSNNARVLVYALNTDGTFRRHTPEYVLGQPDLFASGGDSSATKSAFAVDLAYDPEHERLFAAEASKNRIVVFDVTSSTMSNNKDASFVLGQPDFDSGSPATSASGFSDVQALAYDSTNERLFAAEGSDGNRRVLVFDVAPGSMANGKDASFVLGQPDFDAVTNAGVITEDSIDDATALAYDETDTRLFVADATGRRVLVFDVAPGSMANGKDASFVLGPADLVTAGSSANTASSVKTPAGLAYDDAGDRLFVSGGNRVLVFDVAPGSMANGKDASFVLGQALFTTNAGGTSATALQAPGPAAYDTAGSMLFVADQDNHRVISFDVESITNGEAAVDEVGHLIEGQVDFDHGGKNNGPGSIGFDASSNVLVDEAGHRLFVSDTNNERVLVFELDASNDLLDYEADHVLGEPDMYTQDPEDPAADVLGGPQGLAYDAAGSRLFVADSGNNRVLVYDVAVITDGEAAVSVLGQTDFTNNSGDIGASALNAPWGLAYDAAGSRLFVADSGNNRVLVYDVAVITDGEAAVSVLGQPDFDSSDGGTSDSTLSAPHGVAYHDARLFVADEGNNRVLVYDVAAITDGEAAAFVIGHADFDSSDSGTSSTALNAPWGLGYDSRNDRIYVGDSNNARVLGFDFSTSSMANGKAASVVLGQDDFTSGTSGTSDTSMGVPAGVAYDASNRRIYVNDVGNNRIMAYNHIRITTLALPDATVGEEYAQEIETENEQGTVSFELALGSLPPGMVVGSVDGTPTAAGTYTFTIQASDSVANAGQLLDNQTYSLTVNAAASNGGGGGRGRRTGGAAPSSTSTLASPAPTPAAATEEDLRAQIASLTAQIASLRLRLGLSANGGPSSASFTFERDLTLGASGPDVMALQKLLNAKGYTIATEGAGSLGQETDYFGGLTQAALARFQAANGIRPAAGYFGPITRAFLQQMLEGSAQ